MTFDHDLRIRFKDHETVTELPSVTELAASHGSEREIGFVSEKR